MPYVAEEKRAFLNKPIDVIFAHCDGKGDINYCITRLVHLWVLSLIKRAKRKSYNLLSLGHSVLCDASAEYYAAVMLPHEKKAQTKNGPVSELDTEGWDGS